MPAGPGLSSTAQSPQVTSDSHLAEQLAAGEQFVASVGSTVTGAAKVKAKPRGTTLVGADGRVLVPKGKGQSQSSATSVLRRCRRTSPLAWGLACAVADS